MLARSGVPTVAGEYVSGWSGSLLFGNMIGVGVHIEIHFEFGILEFQNAFLNDLFTLTFDVLLKFF